MDRSDPAYKGQAGYTPFLLAVYDPFVLGFMAHVDARFDSAALSFVLHCLRGPQANKAAAIRNVADVLEPDGVLFGGTVLGIGERQTAPARAVLRAFNRHGDFDNLGDTAEGLRRILAESFQTVEVDVTGSAALFAASGPRGPG